MRKEKKQPTQRESLSAKGKIPAEILKNIEEENEMFDDHGPVILGGRDKKPVLPKPKREED